MPEESRLQIIEGDITLVSTEAIVNAANRDLAPGGGVCGAIYAAAGPELETETDSLQRIETGEAVLTNGYNLCPYIIHAVGPIYSPGAETQLRQAYESALNLAVEHKISSVAFPLISAGIYGYPVEEAAAVAIETIIEFLADQPDLAAVLLVCRGWQTYERVVEIYQEYLGLETSSY